MNPGSCIRLIAFDPETNRPFSHGYRVWWPSTMDDDEDNPYLLPKVLGLALAEEDGYTLVLFIAAETPRMGWIPDDVLQVA